MEILYRNFDDIKETLYTMPDESLLGLLKNIYSEEDAYYILKYIMDENALKEISANPNDFFKSPLLDEQTKKKIGLKAEKILAALKKDIIIKPLSDIDPQKVNKFVVCLDENTDIFILAWGNSDQYSQHYLLTNQLSKDHKTTPHLTTGGKIRIKKENDNLIIKLSDMSEKAEYGKFNPRLLEKYKQKILEALNIQFEGKLDANSLQIE